MATFDALAPTYDDDFTRSAIGTHLRNRIHYRLLELWQAGDHILELGCGTGEDALFLGSQGIQVTATDTSQQMLAIARQKTKHLQQVKTQHLNLSRLPDTDFLHDYQGILSNFGALNCITDWKSLAYWLSSRVQSGGTVAFAIMSPYCVWEIIWHGLHLDFGTATRRWKSSTTFSPDNQIQLKITYPSIRRITQDFSPHFQRTRVQPLGVFLPPSDVYPVIEKRPALLNLLTKLDDRLATHSKLSLFADHYWIELQRV